MQSAQDATKVKAAAVFINRFSLSRTAVINNRQTVLNYNAVQYHGVIQPCFRQACF